MGKIVLFELPKIEPKRRWCPTEADIQRYGRERVQEMQGFGEISRRIDNSTREKVAVLVAVLGLRYLADLCVDCALAEIVKLCERPDVYAVLTAYQQRNAGAVRKAI